MSEPTVNHTACVRAAKGNIMKVARDITILEGLDCETLDVQRIDRVVESLNRAYESYEVHQGALRDNKEITEATHDKQLKDQQAVYEKHILALTSIQDKHAAVTLISELCLSLDELELNAGVGYSPAISHDLDHAASLAHRVRQARAKPAVRHCREIASSGEKTAQRLFLLQQVRADHNASLATSVSTAPTII